MASQLGRAYMPLRRLACLMLYAFACGCGSMAVVIESDRIVSPKLSGIRRVAVMGLTSNSELVDGQFLGTTLASEIVGLNYYQMVERTQVDKLLGEHGFQMSAMVDETAAAQAGKILATDAVIFGQISAASVKTERGRKLVTNLTPSGHAAQEHQPTAVKRGVVSIDLRLVKVETAETVVSLAKTDEILEPPIGSAVGEAEIGGLGSDDAIARELVKRLCEEFVDEIKPFIARGTRYIHKGTGRDMERGYLFAKQCLWDKAIEAWSKAAKDDPDNAAACNNLGVGYERAGDRENAGMWYDKAVTVDPAESDFAKNYTGFRGGLKPVREKRKSKVNTRRLMQGLRGASRLLLQSYQAHKGQSERGTAQPCPLPPNQYGAQPEAVRYHCSGCGNLFAGPRETRSKTACPMCGTALRTYGCTCGQFFAAPFGATRAKCPRCGHVHRARGY